VLIEPVGVRKLRKTAQHRTIGARDCTGHVSKANLLSRLRGAARLGRAALNRIVRPQPAHEVRFPVDADVLAALRGDVPALAQVRSAARSGDIARARDMLVAYFRERAAPRFFLDRAEVRPLADRLAAARPDWRAEALQSAADWQRYVYSGGDAARRTLDLPDWNNLPLGPGSDTVNQHKAHHFLFAVQLARAKAYGAQSTGVLRRLIDSWIAETNGRPGSPAYWSPLVAVHRAVALTWTWTFLAGSCEPDLELEFLILRIIIADARFVHARLGTSAPNNHLLADAFLMFYLGILYPELHEAERWRRDGEALFLRELRRQIYEDGTSFEHSVHYHELACEMVTAIVLLARRNGIELEPWVEQRLARMLRFQALLGGPRARSVAIGDNVETHLLPLDGFDGIGAASHRELLRALFDADVPPSSPDAPGQERAAWLLAGRFESSRPTVEDSTPVAFPDGGFVVLPDSGLESCMIFRTGPIPGRVRSAGHMHADLLSVYVRLGRMPMIVDAGTFTYRARKERWPAGEPPWRAHFLGPSAHNALCIEGRDPLDRGPGDFPAGPLKAEVVASPLATGGDIAWTEATVVSETLYGGHARGVVHVFGHYWLVYDLLPPAATATSAWLSLHFSDEAVVRRQGPRTIVATCADRQLVVASSARQPEMQLMKASRRPLGGWVSPRYGELSPAVVCRIVTTGGPMAAATLLQPVSSDAGNPLVEVQQADSGAVGMRITRESRVDYLILPRGSSNNRTSLFGIDLEGGALWLRTERARPIDLRGLAVSRAESGSLGFSVTGRRGPREFRLAFGQEAGALRESNAADVDVVLR
jgi:hypothetical protein